MGFDILIRISAETASEFEFFSISKRWFVAPDISRRQIWSHHNLCGRQPSSAVWWSHRGYRHEIDELQCLWRCHVCILVCICVHTSFSCFRLCLKLGAKLGACGGVFRQLESGRQIHHHCRCIHAECPSLRSQGGSPFVKLWFHVVFQRDQTRHVVIFYAATGDATAGCEQHMVSNRSRRLVSGGALMT